MKLAPLAVAALLLALAPLQAGHAGPDPAQPLVVNSVADPGDGVCDESECTLREALIRAGGVPGPSAIHFNIPGDGPHTIAPLSALPGIIEALTIDGTTQPGYDGSPLVELNGGNVPYPGDGLAFYGSNGNVVRGLAINRFPSAGLYFNNSGGNLIEANYLGTDLTGTIALPNESHGILFAEGGDSVITDNLVSGNQMDGIGLAGADGNTVQGNLIGVGATGAAALPNGGDGIRVSGVNNLIGGPGQAEGNVISGNGSDGIVLSEATTSGTLIQGNRIGADISGKLPLPNADVGVLVINGAHDNLIGGPEPGQGNAIANNGSHGIRIDGVRNEVSGNSIHDNAAAGIALTSDGDPQPNDPGDADSGPNQLQNNPVIELAHEWEVTLSFDSAPNTVFQIRLFANTACDESGYGEGKSDIGGLELTTNALGKASAAIEMPGLRQGLFVTATATDPDGNTSEFSRCALVEQGRFPLYEGWNRMFWPEEEVLGAETIVAELDAVIEPDAWQSVAVFEGAWQQTFRDPPLPGFNTLTSLGPGVEIWLYLSNEAAFFSSP